MFTKNLSPYLIIAFLYGCGARTPGYHDESGEEDLLDRDGWSVTTTLSHDRVSAGMTVAAVCRVMDGTQILEGERTRVTVLPSVGLVESEGDGRYTFVPTSKDTYVVRCETLDGALVDGNGAELEVVAAGAVAVESALALPSAPAGVPVGVDCTAFDAYGNQLTTLPAGMGLVAESPLDSNIGIHNDFVVRGTLVGTYDVACSLPGGVSDLTPESLLVTVGDPGWSQTTVSPSAVGPTEVATISCEFADMYGNPISNISTRIVVMAADGSAPAGNGLNLGASEVSATKMGRYYVFCTSPGYWAGDETPAILTVGHGLPHSWVVDTLEQDCYWQDRTVPIDWYIYDRWGNPVEDAQVEVTADPTNGFVADSQGRYRLILEADYDLMVEVLGEQDPESTIEPYHLSIRVDSTPPAISFNSPARAAMLQQGDFDDAVVPVDGTVTDALSSLEAVSINGDVLDVNGTDTAMAFSREQSSRWGMTTITGYAEDECGNRRVVNQSYLRGPEYFAPMVTADPSVQAAHGILAHLNQPIIDDGDRGTLNDLATLAEVAISNQDFNAMVAAGTVLAEDPIIPNQCSWGEVSSDDGYRIARHADPARRINWSGPIIRELKAVEGGMRLDANLSDFDFPLSASAGFIVCFLFGGVDAAEIAIDAWVGASSVDFAGTLAIELVDGEPSVSLPEVTLATTGLYVDADCGFFDFLCDALTGLIIPLVAGQIESAIEGAIADNIPPLLEGFLKDFALEQGFEIPPPIDMTLNIASGFDHMTFAGENGVAGGFGELGLGAQIYPSARDDGVLEDAPGALRRNGTLPEFDRSAYRFGLGLKDDLVNQVLWALWYGGGMNFDNLVDTVTGFGAEADPAGNGDAEPASDFSDVLSLSMRSELPPVVMPGRGGYEVQVGLGDVWIEVSVDLIPLLGGEDPEGDGMITIGAYLSALLSGSIDIDSTTNSLQVVFDPDPDIYVQVVRIDDEGYQSQMSELLVRILKLLLPRLLGDALGSFPIPEFDLTTMAGDGVLPAGTVWQLTNGSIERAQNDYYYLLTGGLE